MLLDALTDIVTLFYTLLYTMYILVTAACVCEVRQLLSAHTEADHLCNTSAATDCSRHQTGCCCCEVYVLCWQRHERGRRSAASTVSTASYTVMYILLTLACCY
jgi:hypothetical protein